MFKHPASRRTVLGGALATAAVAVSKSTTAEARGRTHVVLLGDSVLDNGAYVGSGPDVAKQLSRQLPMGARTTLAAVDGSVTSDVRRQLKLIPADATHLVVSAGGNDALHYAAVLEEKAGSVAEALYKLASIRERFVADYSAMLDDVVASGLPVAACTIYDAQFPDQKQRRVASVGLTIFNECITREVSGRGLALIDLRLICGNPEDLANPIEPSVIGGAKIASAIAAFAAEYDWSKGRSEVFAQASVGL